MLGRGALFVKAADPVSGASLQRLREPDREVFTVDQFLLVILLLAVVVVAAYFYLKRRQQHVHLDEAGGAVEHRHPHDPKVDTTDDVQR